MDQHPANNRPMIVVVMGVSSSGKTTVAKLLAETLGWQFEEGDTLHPPENVEKMSAGIPLTDDDRLPWLRKIAETIDGWRAHGQSGVVTCSALKRSYREIIVGDRPNVRLVYLRGSPDLIRRRMAARRGHFMPAALLDSQFSTLEEPSPDENPIVVDIGRPPEEIATEIAGRLGLAQLH
jgi:carbohydrate kinase (thermoresistant glucokinase family)